MAETSPTGNDEGEHAGPMIVQLQTLRALAKKGLLTHEDVGQIVRESEEMLAEPLKSRFRQLAETITPPAPGEDDQSGQAPDARKPVNFSVTPKQILDAQRAIDTASLNGILFLAMLLKKLRIMTSRHCEVMHGVMSKPLNLRGNADNPMVQIAQRRLDEHFAQIREAPGKQA